MSGSKPTLPTASVGADWSGAEYLRDLFGRDPEAALSLLADDISWIVPGDTAFGGGTHSGREAVLAFFGQVLELFPEGLAIEWMREWHGDEGRLVEAVLCGRTAAGHDYRNHYVFVLETKQGRVQRVREYADTSYAESVLGKGLGKNREVKDMDDAMKRMKPFVLITDIGFILYWSASLLILLGLDIVPASWLFKDYDDPIIYAWNWSFFPLDMVLSTCGLLAIRRHGRGDPSWRSLAAFSLALTFCAGFMAICFWAIRLDFDPSWWGANLFLTIWPCFFLPQLTAIGPPSSEERGIGRPQASS